MSDEIPRRPIFSSSVTNDRLSEAQRVPYFLLCTIKTDIKKGRRSVFQEIGLDDTDAERLASHSPSIPTFNPSTRPSHYRSQPSQTFDDILRGQENSSESEKQSKLRKEARYKPQVESVDEKRNPWYSRLAPKGPQIKSACSAPTGLATLPRVAMIAFLLAIVVPGFLTKGPNGVPADGASAGVIRTEEQLDVRTGQVLGKREDSPTDTCTRWSHQSAVLNGTLYIYSGQSKTKSDQSEDTWNNNFLTLDLTTSWAKTSPALKGLSKPDGPPAVANGYLWNSYESLFLYGGLYSDSPPTTPDSVSTWEYQIEAQKWIEHANPDTTYGNFSEPAGVPIQRSAEGAGLSIPELGLSYYFGGHQDMYTTQGWSNQIGRIYLNSMLEFTHPGYMNTGVEGLGIGEKGTGTDGTYRNITEGGIQEKAGFTERADGVLVYIPGWGESGIILGLAGGTADVDGQEGSFTEMSPIDIYDIASSTWYKQSTEGESPPMRVNPCAAVFAAPDASSFNVYLYGGQSLTPYEDQEQYDDMWILTVPSFTWIKVPFDGQSKPSARAGHSCHAWDSQMIVVGGYVGKDISCDSPGIYVFNASNLEWKNEFTAVPGTVAPAPVEPNGVGSGGGANRQKSNGDGDFIKGEGVNTGGIYAGLAGSNGYTVPQLVVSKIGGGPLGSATATAPAAGTPTDGPIATGKPPVFTITAPGTTIMATATAQPDPSLQNPNNSSSGPNKPAIIAGVIAGVLGLLATYLAFCTWLYRRQLGLYKNHVAMAQRAAFTNSPNTRMFAHEKTHTNLGRAGAVGAGGLAAGGLANRNSAEPRTSVGSSAGGGLGGGITRLDLVAKGGRNETTTTEEGHLAGGSGESDYGSGRSSFDSLGGMEPSFISVVMSPRRTLRVINQDG